MQGEGGFTDLLVRLIKLPGVSGYEAPVREAIRGLVSGLGKTWTDSVGNLYLDLGGEGPTILYAAHMDEIGLVVTDITDDGLLRFRKIGGIEDLILPSTQVTVHTSKGDVPGVIGVTPPHLRLERQEQQAPQWHQLYIDVGASSRREAEELGVRPLDPVTLDKSPVLLAGSRALAARAVDDRLGCAALVQLARVIAGGLRVKARVVLAWTVQEEVGLRGALAAARSVGADLAVAVDTMACCRPEVTGPARWGGGPVIRAVDNAYIADPALVSRIRRLAESRGIRVQVATAGGGTDAAAFQRQGVRSIALCAPVKYAHSTVELLNLDDARGLVELLAAVAEEPPV
ncbi:M42 family metallopeptidase [Stetteria hydrogenophila]